MASSQESGDAGVIIKEEIKEEIMDYEDQPEYVFESVEVKTEPHEEFAIKHEEIQIKPDDEPEPGCSNSSNQSQSSLLLQNILDASRMTQTHDLHGDDDDDECESEMSDDDESLDKDMKREYQKRYDNFKKLEAYLLSRTPGDKSSDEEEDESMKLNSSMIYQFKITLLGGIFPRIWRRIQVPGDLTFHEFHICIQKAMGWESVEYDYHLHQFHLHHPKYGFEICLGEPIDEIKDEKKYKIYQMINKNKNASIMYEYDLGFGWEHGVVLEDIFVKAEGAKYPVCTDGARACPPEDVGSLGGSYTDFCDAINNKDHPDHEEFTKWLERDHFDPEEFDATNVFKHVEAAN